MNQVKIDPAAIPSYAWEQGFRIVADSLKRLLADPKIRAEYEAWKEAQTAV